MAFVVGRSRGSQPLWLGGRGGLGRRLLPCCGPSRFACRGLGVGVGVVPASVGSCSGWAVWAPSQMWRRRKASRGLVASQAPCAGGAGVLKLGPMSVVTMGLGIASRGRIWIGSLTTMTFVVSVDVGEPGVVGAADVDAAGASTNARASPCPSPDVRDLREGCAAWRGDDVASTGC